MTIDGKNLVVSFLLFKTVFILASCSPSFDWGGSDSSPEANARFGSFFFVQSGDTTDFIHADLIDPIPNIPFEIHWNIGGDPGLISVIVVHNECGNVHIAGPDYPDCPRAEWKFEGETGWSTVGVRVSGLPGGREYMMSFLYKVSGGSISTSRWLDLSAATDTSGDLSSIYIEPLKLSKSN